MRKYFVLTIIFLLVAGIVGMFVYFHFASSGSQQLVRMGYLPVSTAIVSLTAKPFLESQGIKVEVIRFESSNDMITALEADKIDVADAIGLSTVLSAEARSPGQLKVFAMAIEDEEHYSNYFLVPANSTASSVSELKGKKIVARPGSAPRNAISLILKSFNLSLSDIQLIQVEPQSQITILASGQADAGLFIEPTASAALRTRAVKVLVPNPRSKYILSPYPVAGYIFSKSFAESNVSKNVVSAYEHAIDKVRANESSAKDLLIVLNIVNDSQTAQTTRLTSFWKLSEIDLANLDKFVAILIETKELEKPLNVSSIIYH